MNRLRYRNGRHGKSFQPHFEYERKIPPLPQVYVPRIIFPKKLPCHTELVPSDILIYGLPFLVALHENVSRKKGQRHAYIHRKSTI